MLYTGYTFQDWLGEKMDTADPSAKGQFIRTIINSYRASPAFLNALEANQYFSGASPVIGKKTMLRGKVVSFETEDGAKHNRVENEEIIGNRVASNFFAHFVIQENQYLLGNGVTLGDDGMKERLGKGFDKTLERIGEKAIIHGASWGFWNNDHLEAINAAKDVNSGFVALVDEMTGAAMVGIQFWRISDKKPLCCRLFEMDGFTGYRENEQGVLVVAQEKRPYITQVYTDAAGEIVLDGQNYDVLPIIPLYANDDQASELTPSIKSKIDLYDRIMSDFGDNLDRANDVYWVLNNFNGDVSTISAMMEYINKLKTVINQNDGMGGNATAEPKTLEVPYQARQAALQLLEKALYKDYMALNMDEITGGSLTNVAIEAAMTNLNLKVDRFEWQCFDFVRRLLRIIGIDTEEIRFHRQSIVNKSEIVADIYTMAQDVDRETRLKLNPYIMQEEIPEILAKVDAESVAGMNSLAEIDEEEDDAE